MSEKEDDENNLVILFPIDSVGVLLSLALSNLLVVLFLPSSDGRVNPLWFLPVLVIPLFMGVIYGPWAGLLSSGVGYFLGVRTPLALPWAVKALGKIWARKRLSARM